MHIIGYMLRMTVALSALVYTHTSMAEVINADFVVSEPLHEQKPSWFNSIRSTVKEYIAQATATGVLKDLAVSYAILLGTVIVHEYTHALLIRLLYGVPCDTYIGVPPVDFRQPAAYSNMLGIVSWLPFDAQYFHAPVKQTPLKELIAAIGGPLMGMLANYACFKSLNASTNKNEYLCAKITSLSGIIGHGYQFVPYDIYCYNEFRKSDGARILAAIKDLFA